MGVEDKAGQLDVKEPCIPKKYRIPVKPRVHFHGVAQLTV
jgi:hypothetical protein